MVRVTKRKIISGKCLVPARVDKRRTFSKKALSDTEPLPATSWGDEHAALLNGTEDDIMEKQGH